jgi:uncharacterized protein
MRFTLESHETANIITAVDAAGVRIGERHFRASLIVGLREIIPEWRAASMADISLQTLEPALSLEPEILLLGTGVRTAFPDPALLAELSRRRIGFEAMDTAAACRTYNVLAHENRAVVAALLVGA